MSKIDDFDKANLSDQTKFTLNEISNIEIILTKRLIKGNHAVKN